MTDRVLAFKKGVSLVGMQPEAIAGIDGCLDCFHVAGLVLTLTSCRDGRHSAHSHHYKGLAWDMRVWDLTGRIDWMCRKLRTRLGPDYQVINEEDHIHAEYDPASMAWKHFSKSSATVPDYGSKCIPTVRFPGMRHDARLKIERKGWNSFGGLLMT